MIQKKRNKKAKKVTNRNLFNGKTGRQLSQPGESLPESDLLGNRPVDTAKSIKDEVRGTSSVNSERLSKSKTSATIPAFRIAKAKSLMSKGMYNLKQMASFQQDDSESEEEYEVKDSEIRLKRNSIHLSDIEDVPEPSLENAIALKKSDVPNGSLIFRKAFLATASNSFESDKSDMKKFVAQTIRKISSDTELDTTTLSSKSCEKESETGKVAYGSTMILKKEEKENDSDFFSDSSESLLDV